MNIHIFIRLSLSIILLGSSFRFLESSKYLKDSVDQTEEMRGTYRGAWNEGRVIPADQWYRMIIESDPEDVEPYARSWPAPPDPQEP